MTAYGNARAPHANVCRVRIGELVADTSAGRARLDDDARKRVRDPAGVRTVDAVRPWRDEHDPLEQVPEVQRATQATDAAHDVEMAVEKWESQANVRFASRWLGGRWGQPCRLFLWYGWGSLSSLQHRVRVTPSAPMRSSARMRWIFFFFFRTDEASRRQTIFQLRWRTLLEKHDFFYTIYLGIEELCFWTHRRCRLTKRMRSECQNARMELWIWDLDVVRTHWPA